MAKKPNQKLKLLYIVKYFEHNTDEEHGITVDQLIEYLEANDVSAERKSIYKDFEELRTFGYDIVAEKKNKEWYYKLVSRRYEMAELKLLTDAVSASKFISETKTRDLIKKLESEASKYQASSLHRQVYVASGSKFDNKTILVTIDSIHEAINDNRSIEFHYYMFNENKELVEKHPGKVYSVSPIALLWDDENYYLVGYDNEAKKLKHFRVDKMGMLVISEAKRSDDYDYSKFNHSQYINRHFSMFSGNKKKVTISVEKSLIGVMVDRFGKDIMIVPESAGRVHFTVEVEVSPQFYGWLTGYGSMVKVTSPNDVVEEYKNYLKDILSAY